MEDEGLCNTRNRWQCPYVSEIIGKDFMCTLFKEHLKKGSNSCGWQALKRTAKCHSAEDMTKKLLDEAVGRQEMREVLSWFNKTSTSNNSKREDKSVQTGNPTNDTDWDSYTVEDYQQRMAFIFEDLHTLCNCLKHPEKENAAKKARQVLNAVLIHWKENTDIFETAWKYAVRDTHDTTSPRTS